MSTEMTYEEKRAAAIARGKQLAYQAVNPTWLPRDEYLKKLAAERLPKHEWVRRHMKFDSYLQKMVFKDGHGYDDNGKFYEPKCFCGDGANCNHTTAIYNRMMKFRAINKPKPQVKGRLVNWHKGNIVRSPYDDAIHSYGLKGLIDNIAIPQSEEKPATQQRKRDIHWKTCNLIGQPTPPDLRKKEDEEQFQTTFEDWSMDMQKQNLEGDERIYDGDKVSDAYGMDVELRTYLEDKWLHSDED